MKEPTSPLQIRDYRLIWLSRFFSTMATNCMVVFIGYQVYDIARSSYGMGIGQAAFQLGLLGLAQFVPLFLLTPVAGLVADRFDRRIVAGAATGIDVVVALALGLTTHFGSLSLPLLFGLAALHGTARVFIGPAVSAITPNIVPVALMPRAVALGAIAWQGGSVLGPALGSVIFASRPAQAYWTSAAILAISALAILLIRRVAQPDYDHDVHPIKQIALGMRYVWLERFLLGCISLDLFAVLLGGATALLPVFARDILHVGLAGLGPMRAAPAVGAALIAALLSIRPIKHNVGAKMLWGVVVYGLATAAFGFSRSYILSLTLLGILGAADMISVFIRTTLIQINTPDPMRGRVSSLSTLAISASNELGEMQSGVAAALIGATGAVVFGGVGAIVITGLWAWLFPELRNARTFDPQLPRTEPAP